MAYKRIKETDVIEVKTTSILLYGPPGSWKTSTAQTALHPHTLDFDDGIHRAFNRKSGGRLDSWGDLDCPELQEDVAASSTVVVDTVGRALDMLSMDVIRSGRSFGTPAGGLNKQGWGALKIRFAQWVANLRAAGKDLVFVAHEKEKTEGDNRYMTPDIQGGSYQEVLKLMDVVGYLHRGNGGSRFIRFEAPDDRTAGKDPCGWGTLAVPNLAQNPTWLADRLGEVKKVIGSTAASTAFHAAALKAWGDWLLTDPKVDDLNNRLPRLADLRSSPPTRDAVWAMIQAYAAGKELSFSRDKKAFLTAGKPAGVAPAADAAAERAAIQSEPSAA